MQLRQLILVAAMSCWLLPAMAQTEEKTARPRPEREAKLSFRNAFEEQDDKAEPAKASFSLPDTGRNSFLINIGISYDWSWKGQYSDDTIRNKTISPFVVFNRNTLIAKQQYSYRGGVAGEYSVGKGNADILKGDLYSKIHYFDGTLQYQRDRVDTTHSIIATAYWTFMGGNASNPDGKIFINYYKLIKGTRLFYYVGPSAGLEFQDIVQAKDTATGVQVRLYGNAEARLAFRWRNKAGRKKDVNPYNYPKLFELIANYIPRYAFVNAIKNSDNYIPMFKTTLNYYPTFNNDLSVGLSYTNGADPIAGLAKQKFWQLAVQFKK